MAEPGDADSLAGMLAEALNLDTEARMALGRRARQVVLRDYTVRAMQDATLAVYETVLSGRVLAEAA